MPSFLNKVFGYKKQGDKEAARPTREASDSTLLDGKYEAIPPILSPSVSTFAEARSTKDSDRDGAFTLFKPKSRGVSQKHTAAVPHLTLQLPGPKENSDSRALGVVFEADPDSQTVLDDAVIAAKHLNPLEALILIRACAQTITERGLETLGIMHPHWFSASPDVQRKLISLFIRSLTPQNRITTLSPTPTAPTSAFEDELHYTRSPHDVAAVLRWGLRHLSLENGHFGKDSAEWAWYNAFFHAERNASYPPKGFSELLLPQLPASHIELLTATLSLISSLAAHAEVNSISGSKLSKFLGIWLLVATRAEQSDDWSRFYARWERAGRILEHLFLARLREESFGHRLPTRLQELVKYYPYNKGPLATEDDLLSRPRFSTRQYDALFVRVEALLTHGAEQPKQHPIQLLLEAFQLPIENPSVDEHMALWNTLKTTASEEASSSDSEGPQFARIFVDETIQLLSSIPADNNVLTSPTLLTSPITKVVSRKRSSSLTKVLERTFSSSNVNNGSTPVSSTSPSSIVITDWAQFSLSGFGDTAVAQPLAALLNQDDDVEVTQPRISRGSGRQRGKSRTRRRRSEDREPSRTPLSSQPEPEPSVVETKLASVHVVQIDEAFIDFWSDAIIDPISANWPTFVICGLKQIPSVEQPIRWLVIEQTYSRQQPQPPRVPSPDGHRGRSPRPSFRSDISGFRINSMFSSARKRFSVFSKSASDLDLKKSGGKTPVAGELGEVLVEEEPTFPSAPDPTKVDHHIDGNAAVGATVTSGATADVADQLKVDENSTAPIAGDPPADLVPVLKEESDPVQTAAEAASVEPTPQPGGMYNGFSVLPRSSSVRAPEEAVYVEQGSPRTLATVSPKVNAADPVVRIAPLAADTSDPRFTQDTSDPMVLASGPALTAEHPVAEEVQIRAKQFRQDAAVEVKDRPVEQPADGDERLPAESTSEPSNEAQVDVASGSWEFTEAVAIPPAPETVAVVAATPVVDDEAPEPTAEEPHVEQPSRKAPADLVAASIVESVRQHVMDDLQLPDVQDKVIVTATGAQLEPDSITSVVDGNEEAEGIAEPAEIPTPAPELVALVEETPGREVSVDGYGRAQPTQVPAAEPEAPAHAASRLRALDDAAAQPVAAELQASLDAEGSSTTHPVVAVEAEHAADRVPESTTEEAQSPVQDTIVPAAAAPVVKPYVSAGIVSTAQQESEDVAPAKAEACIVETQDTGAPTLVLENAALVDETPSPEIATEARGIVEATPGSEAVEDKAPELIVEATVEAEVLPTESTPLTEEAQSSIEAELPTQLLDLQHAETLSTKFISEAATAALATVDEVIALKEEAQPTPDASTEDAEAHTPAPESAPIEASEPAQVTPSTAADPEPVEDKATEAVIAAPCASALVAITPTVIIEEPVAQDVQIPIEIEEPSSESAPQSVDGAASPPILATSVPEEIIAVKVEVQLESRVVHPTVDTAPLAREVGVSAEETQALMDASEPGTLSAKPELVGVNAPTPVIVEEAQVPAEAEEPSPVAAECHSGVEIGVTSGINGPQEVLLADQPVTSEIDVSTHEPAGLSEEVTPAEP